MAKLKSMEALFKGRHFEQEIIEYRVHAVWLSNQIDSQWLLVLEERLKRALIRKGQHEKIFVWAVVIFFVLDFIWVTLFGRR